MFCGVTNASLVNFAAAAGCVEDPRAEVDLHFAVLQAVMLAMSSSSSANGVNLEADILEHSVIKTKRSMGKAGATIESQSSW